MFFGISLLRVEYAELFILMIHGFTDAVSLDR